MATKRSIEAAPADQRSKKSARRTKPYEKKGVVVTVGTSPDGFTVYGSALKPKHRSAKVIASAVAKIL